MSEIIIDEKLEYIDYEILNPPDDYLEAYGDGFPQDENIQLTLVVVDKTNINRRT